MLEVSNLSFSYGTREILHSVSLRIPDNMIVSILGPNGVGKTTLLNCICNIHRASKGSIMLDEADLTLMKGKTMARNIGYVPQNVPRTHTTVFDSILLGRKPYFDINATKDDLNRVGSVISELNLSDLSVRYCTEISGGEFQKVQIARAVVQEPKILVLDEPTNNLDVANQHITLSLIDRIVKMKGMSAVMTMHDINLAAAYSDYLIFVSDGRVESCGGPEIVTPELIKKVYGIDVDVIVYDGKPIMIPKVKRYGGD